MYLALDRLRDVDVFEFPGSLPVLRSALKAAADALECQHCPMTFLSALQNALLVGVLLMSVAQCYAQILQSLAQSATILDSPGSNGTAVLRKTSVVFSENATEPITLGVDLNEVEWTSLAKKALLNEIQGVPEDTRPFYMRVLERLESRQTFWHTMLPPPDAPSTFRTTCSPDRPACLSLADEARRLICSLQYD